MTNIPTELLRTLVAVVDMRSFTRAGSSTIFMNLKGSTASDQVPQIWYHVRKSIDDMRHTLPAGVVGPAFDDEFGLARQEGCHADVGSLHDVHECVDGEVRVVVAVLLDREVRGAAAIETPEEPSGGFLRLRRTRARE